MNPTQQFIEDAIAGGLEVYGGTKGWEVPPKEMGEEAVELKGDYVYCWGYDKDEVKTYTAIHLYKVLLDPLAWQAVGKQRGWALTPEAVYDKQSHWTTWSQRFFENLMVRRMSIDEALAELGGQHAG
ncbi:hypothetical protein [Devosia sp. CN2-171]|uniref:hypothetical protein n=1 Tax=Devosia sp. CN2-171 TaxID=3400909 RepID=UPI003BF7FA9C